MVYIIRCFLSDFFLYTFWKETPKMSGSNYVKLSCHPYLILVHVYPPGNSSLLGNSHQIEITHTSHMWILSKFSSLSQLCTDKNFTLLISQNVWWCVCSILTVYTHSQFISQSLLWALRCERYSGETET